MGYDMRPASWDGNERPKISAKLAACSCGTQMRAYVDTSGFWLAECHGCSSGFYGSDNLGCETWQELVRDWNANSKQK